MNALANHPSLRQAAFGQLDAERPLEFRQLSGGVGLGLPRLSRYFTRRMSEFLPIGWLAVEVVSLGKGQAALTEAVKQNDAELIELKEGQERLRGDIQRLRDDMEHGFNRIEDIQRGRDTPE